MSLHGSFFKRTFTFRFDARTSRGPMKEKTSWFLRVWGDDQSRCGIGECGPLPGLSIDNFLEIEKVLTDVVARIQSIDHIGHENIFSWVEEVVPPGFPAITFALETALLDLSNGGNKIIFDNGFNTGKTIPINGLVWMADEGSMLRQVHEKVAQGFRCIKLKVGALDFDRECRMLETIRKHYSPANTTLRLDANGAFSPDEALTKLRMLSTFTIHSIEQPIKPGLEMMEVICRESPIPIALDEELIGREQDKQNLLKKLRPQYIILKPTLHGGLNHCRLWIEEAERLRIGWWITSALESNIGLNAICQFTANYDIELPQGLGTGSLYTNNIQSPLRVDDGFIRYDSTAGWDQV